MKRIKIIVFSLLAGIPAFAQQPVEVGKIDKPVEKHRDKSELALNYTGSAQNLGYGLTTGIMHTTDYNMVYGFDINLYYRAFNSDTPAARVTNVSMLLPVTVGYRFSFSNVFIIPNAGLFGGFASQLQVWSDASKVASDALILDWGYIVGVKAGYQWPKIGLYLGIAHLNNIDADGSDGHFFKATPVSLGVMYYPRHRKKRNR